MARYTADQNFLYFCTVMVLDWVPIFTNWAAGPSHELATARGRDQ